MSDSTIPPVPSEFTTIGQPTPVPARTPGNFVCLRGPCRHYWHLVTMAQAGNPADTWEALGIPEPRKHHHVCLLSKETEFEDDNAFECNKWDPIDPLDLFQIKRRRTEWEKIHGNRSSQPE